MVDGAHPNFRDMVDLNFWCRASTISLYSKIIAFKSMLYLTYAIGEL
jgi:hypothetical protein